MTGIVQALLGRSAGKSLSPPWDVRFSAAAGVNAGGRLNVNPDGTFSQVTTSGTYAGSNGISNWYSPTTANIGASYWCRLTMISGTLNSTNMTPGVWKSQNGTTMLLGFADSTANQSASFMLEFATDSAGNNIAFVISGMQVRTTHP